jgi:hypothetical protein
VRENVVIEIAAGIKRIKMVHGPAEELPPKGPETYVV